MSHSRFLAEQLNRRTLIAKAFVALVGTLSASRSMAVHERDALLREWLPTSYPAARALGDIYLQRHPDETAPRLISALFGEVSWESAQQNPVDDLVRRMRAACARDYASGDMVLLDGWLLARSEARLLALTAILSAP